LQHPNVIAVYDVGTFDGDVFIAMELVEGASLYQWLKQPARSRKQIMDVFLAAGEGLAAAHDAGLVHRDFKPDNVMIGNDGRVRVLDFGLARIAAGGTGPPPSMPAAASLSAETADPTVNAPMHWPSTEATLTAPPELDGTPVPHSGKENSGRASSGSGRSGPSLLAAQLTLADSIVGTPRFMSPEQRMGTAIDRRADEFSFCVALYQVLYGAYPFAGTPHDEVRDWRVLEPPEGSSVPRWLRKVLLKGLSEKPDDRYASMPELLEALAADPSVARRRWWSIAGGVAVVAGAVGAWGTLERRHARVCTGAERELAGVWDDARRAQVSAAFHKSGLPYADAALATVTKTFDDYARSWLAMHVDACEATRVRGDQSQELLDLRMACLSGRFTELRTLSDLFASADPRVVEHAAQSAQSLPSLALCADAAALKAPIPPPRDPKILGEVGAVREQIARAGALEGAAKFDEGLEVARAALTRADALAYPPAIAEAELRVGQLLGDRGDYADSARALHRAYVSATAGRDDEAATHAATNLVIAIGNRQARYDEGDRWADVAEALAGRMQRKDELLGVLYSTRSSLREHEGKYDLALDDARRALALEERVLGPDDFHLAETHYHLGAIHYYRAEYADALAEYKKSLEIQSRVVGPDHPALLGAKVGIADVYGDSGDHPRALAEYESVLATMRRVRPEDPDIPMIQNNLGGELQQLDRPAEAFEQYRLAFEDWQKRIGPGKETITALSNMGEAKIAMNQPEDALRYYSQGLELCGVTLGPEHHDCARLVWGVGEAYRLLGRTNEAMESYRRSLALAEKALGPKHPQLTGPLLGIGRIELARRAPEKAKEALERALAILGDDPGEGLTAPDARFLLAQALWALGDKPGAAELVAKARELYEAAGGPGKRALAGLTAWSDSHH
jgi:tetratricopeptide (TPR) repeat protein